MLEEHNYVKKRVMRAPIDALDHEGGHILERICGSGKHNCKGTVPSAMVCGNQDLQSVAPQVSHWLENLHASQQHLNHMWQMKKLQLEQCFQLRLFEQDVEKVSWSGIYLNFRPRKAHAGFPQSWKVGEKSWKKLW